MAVSSQSYLLYDRVVEISEDFLGPAGERFIRRQIETHFNIEPEKLSQKHLPELVDWVRVTFNVLTKDKQHVNEFSNRLWELAKKPKEKTTSPTKSKR